jgi:pantetheine hydrolase
MAWYVASVVTFTPAFLPFNISSAIQANLASLIPIISNASAADHPDIIVLPEYAFYRPLFTNRSAAEQYAEPIVDPLAFNHSINPCLNGDDILNPILKTMSCLARDLAVYLVFDMGEVELASSNLFNTMVAMDRQGNLINRYRKTHLFFEDYFEPGDHEVRYFNTDFGVRFGMLICFDLMFDDQIRRLKQLGANNFVVSMWWSNAPPWITANQVQQAKSRYWDINLIAANTGSGWYNSGSGLYASGHIISSRYELKEQVDVLTGRLQTRTSVHFDPPRNLDSHVLTDQSNCSTIPPKPLAQEFLWTNSSRSGTLIVKHRNLSCMVKYELSDELWTDEIFALVMFEGDDICLNNVHLCGFMKCRDSKSCMDYALSSEAEFSSLHLELRVERETLLNGQQVLFLASKSEGNLIDEERLHTKTHGSSAHFKISGPVDLLSAVIMF